MKRYVLDANALIALLQDESGAEKVSDIINAAYKGEVEIIMHKANLLEVYYDAYRYRGQEQADLMLAEVEKCPIQINAEITDEIFTEAGRLKAMYKMSFADSFALAQASIFNGALLTSDHHEFDVIEGNESINFVWIR